LNALVVRNDSGLVLNRQCSFPNDLILETRISLFSTTDRYRRQGETRGQNNQDISQVFGEGVSRTSWLNVSYDERLSSSGNW
jgi:hypothetical protein